MHYPYITHHGGARSVTGSCHQLHLDANASLLVDCGLHQGLEASASRNAAVDFSIQGIEALLLTHVHLDHVGRIPGLVSAGFRGPIICSEPTARLLPLVLEDALSVAGWMDRAEVRRFVSYVEGVTVALGFSTWHVLIERKDLQVKVRLQRAGHLLGSAYIECDVRYPLSGLEKRIVFSGDVGAATSSLLCAPRSPESADVLVLESTYGDRLHLQQEDRQHCLERAIDRALKDKGAILIPAFSVGRTQELLFEIEDILHRKSLLVQASGGRGGADVSPVDWPQLPVILDSPLAGRLTRVYREMESYWSEPARERIAQGRRPLSFNQLITIENHQQHETVVNYLASTGRPAIVIAGNGMCSGGRIVNYLKAMLGDPRHEVLFVGYQAKGSPGAVIQASEGAPGFVMIDLDAQMYEIRAKVITVPGYSAHADQAGLIKFVLDMPHPPGEVVLVHGEQRAKRALAAALEQHAGKLGRVRIAD